VEAVFEVKDDATFIAAFVVVGVLVVVLAAKVLNALLVIAVGAEADL